MSENSFADCQTAEAVLWRFKLQTSGAMARGTDSVNRLEAEALARIRELTPPADDSLTWYVRRLEDQIVRLKEPPTVSEEARDRACQVIESALEDVYTRKPGCQSIVAIASTFDRIIDALGYTPEPTGPGCDNCGSRTCGGQECLKYDTLALPPVVELTPAELREAAALVEGFAELHRRTFKITESEQLPSSWPVPIMDAQLPVRVMCGEADWVLRIGGTDE